MFLYLPRAVCGCILARCDGSQHRRRARASGRRADPGHGHRKLDIPEKDPHFGRLRVYQA